jgi:hypothetical protein
MIIFPDGKTQRFTKLTIKIFIMIYIIDNVFLSSKVNFDSFLNDIAEGDKAFIELINKLSVLYNIYPCTEKIMTTIEIYPDKINKVPFFEKLYKSFALNNLLVLLIYIRAIIKTVIMSAKL